MGERPITKGNAAPELISEKGRQHYSINVTVVLIVSIVAVSIILVLLFILAALKPEVFPGALSTAFTILVSVIGSGLISWYSSAYHSGKDYEKDLGRYAATAMDHIDHLWAVTSTTLKQVENHIQWSAESNTTDRNVLIEKFMGLRSHLRLMESAVHHALVSWRNLAPEQFKEIEFAKQVLDEKLHENARFVKLQHDVDTLENKIATAKADVQQEHAQELRQLKLEMETIKQKVTSQLTITPPGFYALSGTIPMHPLDEDMYAYKALPLTNFSNYPFSRKHSLPEQKSDQEHREQ